MILLAILGLLAVVVWMMTREGENESPREDPYIHAKCFRCGKVTRWNERGGRIKWLGTALYRCEECGASGRF